MSCEVKCPYCDFIYFVETEELPEDGDFQEEDCRRCGEIFNIYRTDIISLISEKIRCPKEVDHAWVFLFSSENKRYYECSLCDELKREDNE